MKTADLKYERASERWSGDIEREDIIQERAALAGRGKLSPGALSKQKQIKAQSIVYGILVVAICALLLIGTLIYRPYLAIAIFCLVAVIMFYGKYHKKDSIDSNAALKNAEWLERNKKNASA